MSAWEAAVDLVSWLAVIFVALWWLCQLRRARRELRQARQELAAIRDHANRLLAGDEQNHGLRSIARRAHRASEGKS